MKCVDCKSTELVVAFDKAPRKCCLDQFLAWRVVGEAQKLKCVCGTLLSSERVEKGSHISDERRRLCALVLRKAVFPTRTDAEQWLGSNPLTMRYDYETEQMERVDVIRETEHGFVVVHRPHHWFARGTLKARWESVGIVHVEGNMLESFDNHIPTDDELTETAAFVERI